MTILDALRQIDEVKAHKKKVGADSTYKHFGPAMKAFASAWPKQSTFTDYLRASGLFFTCPREFVLNYWQPTNNKSFDIKSHMMMSVGTHLHEFLQNIVLGPMGVLKGRWVHSSQRNLKRPNPDTFDYHPAPEVVISQFANQSPIDWGYREEKVWDEKYRIRGHMDGIVSIDRLVWLSENIKLVKKDPTKAFREIQSIGTGEEAHLEIKTTGSYQYNNLRSSAQIPDYYKMQAGIYQELGGFDNTLFLYVDRDTLAMKPLVYHREPAVWKSVKNKARVVWEAIRDETLPDSFMACANCNTTRARGCTFKKPCWDKKLDFKKYVADGKLRADTEGRKLLDLSGVSY